MPNMTDAQTMAATCCFLESCIRGTFRPREMVAKDRTASAGEVSQCVTSRWFRDLQIAAMICVSMPNWLENPPAK